MKQKTRSQASVVARAQSLRSLMDDAERKVHPFLGNATVYGRDWYTPLNAPVLTLGVTVPGGNRTGPF